MIKQYLNKIIQGDNIEIMKAMPDNSVDLVFADPPYNLQLNNTLLRPNQSEVAGVDDQWDKFASFDEYDKFTIAWLIECKRVLKKDGSLWVIGSYHNIYRVGKILQDLGFWILNDVVWIKTNPMPNFKGTRFNNAHETLLWCSQDQKAKFTFHYKAMKAFNDEKQMRSDWHIPICSGKERLKKDGKKVHSTQKPNELLYRLILASSNIDDIILDPFMGSGTTGAVAKLLRRNFIGIEKEQVYIDPAVERIENVIPLELDVLNYKIEIMPPKVPFGHLITQGYLNVGESLYDSNGDNKATILANGSLETEKITASIHKVSASILGKASNNGWTYWNVLRGIEWVVIDDLRTKYIEEVINKKGT